MMLVEDYGVYMMLLTCRSEGGLERMGGDYFNLFIC